MSGSSTRPLHVAILRNDHLGDLILTTGLARNLALAGWNVDVICKASWRPVFDHSPHARAFGFGVDGVPDAHDSRALGSWLRSQAYSHLIIPHKDKSLLWASFKSGVPQRWAQFGGWPARLSLHHCLPSRIHQNPRHLADIWMDFARRQGVSVDDGHPEIFLSQEERNSIRHAVDARLGRGDYLVIHPFHGRSSCNWPVEKYVELACRLAAERSARIVLTGSATERSALDGFSMQLNNANVWLSCGELDLRQFFALIGGAKNLICSSTGALHVSSALNIPSISMFCPHPTVGPALWKSFAPTSEVVSPPPNLCPRFSESLHCQDCGLLARPTITELSSLVK